MPARKAKASTPAATPKATARPLPFRRVLLKVSGEGLMGDREFGLDNETVLKLARDVQAVVAGGFQVCLVIGGGNIFRGLSGASNGMDRTTADYMGMLATVINALAVQTALESLGVPTRVQSAIAMAQVCESYIRRRAMRHMEKGRVVVFAAGTGNPFFTTDTAAALRAVEMNCDALLKATQVDGVYDSDPKKNKAAKRFDRLSFDKVIADDLKVMDTAAIALARENNLPIVVFDMHKPDAVARVLRGEGTYTLIAAAAGRAA
ncbi:MAG: UMP kinase [Rhodospirillaceae bacterium]|nr:UMP kinase [Rhodospirillaceae bacterium]